MRMLASRSDDGYVRIMIGDYRSALLELLKQPVTWRFTFVVDVRLVGQAEDKNPASFDSLTGVV